MYNADNKHICTHFEKVVEIVLVYKLVFFLGHRTIKITSNSLEWGGGEWQSA